MEWDEAKRQSNIDRHHLDFVDVIYFDMATATHRLDRRREYGEERLVSTGFLHGRLCVLCWTLRDGQLRIISLRKANDREQKAYSDARR
jgi:uncharacterized DUF497 family protein